MIIVTAPDHVLHNPPHEFFDGALIPVFETPERAAIILDALREAGAGPIVAPRAFGTEPLRAVHTDPYLAYLETAYERWVAAGGATAAVIPSTLAVRWMGRPSAHPLAAPGYYTFDLSAPIVAGTYRAARSSAGAALTGAALLLEGQRAAYALCRPPGHHAGSDMCGGYCFLNNAAIAAEHLLRQTEDEGRRTEDQGTKDRETKDDSDSDSDCDPLVSSSLVLRPSRVAILDIDFHHGNGTQQIFYERGDVLVVSIHADPRHHYPYFLGFEDERGAGPGLGANHNIVLPPGADDARYLEALRRALSLVRDFRPRALVVSAGLDTYAGDPVAEGEGSFALSAAAYPAIGREIASLGLPTLFVQEGGYGIAALGSNVVGLLRGFEGG